jgi:hypothetical protein
MRCSSLTSIPLLKERMKLHEKKCSLFLLEEKEFKIEVYE